jgi:regulator of sigma E protease
MDLLITVLTSTFWVVLALTILVFVHELGHFLTAKWFGMRVERFSIGFPPTVLRRKMGNTEYAVGATPLGGYVKISGMIDESLDTDHQAEEAKPWEFRSKPVWQRIVVITAGVIFNVILAAIIFGGIRWAEGETFVPADNIESIYVAEGSVAHDIGLRTGDHVLEVNGESFERFDQILVSNLVAADSLTITVRRDGQTEVIYGPRDIITRVSRARNDERGFGVSYLPPLIGGVQSGMPADTIGLRTGDRIVGINGEPIRFWAEMSDVIQASEGEAMTVEWFRADSLTTDTSAAAGSATLVTRREGGAVYRNRIQPTKTESGRYVFGVTNAQASPQTMQMIYDQFGIEQRSYGPVEAVTAGAQDVWTTSRNIVITLQRVVTGRDELRESLGGPVMIAKVTSEAAEQGAVMFWRLVAALSVTLAIMNILPVPALDGGQLMFLLYEGVTRRKPSVRVRLVAQQIGMILLLGFMTFLIFNDILRL